MEELILFPKDIGEITPTGLTLRDGLSFAQWHDVGQRLQQVEKSVLWWVGDWLNYGERRYGEKYTQALEETGFSLSTLQNAKWVAKAIETSSRLEVCSWATHQEVAQLPPPQQKEVLDRAQGMTRREVRQLVRKLRHAKKGSHARESICNEIRKGDFREVLADIPDESARLILTDPPYAEESISLYGDLGDFARRKLSAGGSLVAYCGQSTLPAVLDALRMHLRYWWLFSVSHRHGGQRMIGKNVLIEWKPLVWFVKEKRFNDEFIADQLRGSKPDKDLHPWAQGMEEVIPIIEGLSDPGDLIIDPFAGSGTFGVAAKSLGRSFIGADIG